MSAFASHADQIHWPMSSEHCPQTSGHFKLLDARLARGTPKKKLNYFLEIHLSTEFNIIY